jgi:glycosyltransferase involved in cell wall biosynthesis
VVAVSEDQAAPWLARGYPAERIVIVPNGVPAWEPVQARAALRAELGIPEEAVVAVLVATLRPEKRAADFVTGVRLARAQHPELIGLAIGEGPERAAVEHAAAGDPAIRLLGFRDDVGRLLGAADIFTLTSEYEAAPMAILEAMAAGLPVVATAVGGIPAIVGQRESGLLVPPRAPERLAEALGELCAAPELRQALGQQGREAHRQRWDAELMIDRYERVLGEVQARQAGGGAAHTNQGERAVSSS